MLIINNKMHISKIIGLGAGILGFLGVGLGAFGAHGLQTILVERGALEVWKTAVEYQLIHAVAMVAVAAWSGVHDGQASGGCQARRRLLEWAGGCWGLGVVMFSGSLDVLAVGGPAWMGPVTPAGGLALLAGWALVAVAAMRGGDGN